MTLSGHSETPHPALYEGANLGSTTAELRDIDKQEAVPCIVAKSDQAQ